jgi:hypothetical protein
VQNVLLKLILNTDACKQSPWEVGVSVLSREVGGASCLETANRNKFYMQCCGVDWLKAFSVKLKIQ